MNEKKFLKLVVFDLDFTLWDAGGVWCDCLLPPFEVRDGNVYDSRQDKVAVYSWIGDALDWLEENEIEIGVASRTDRPDWAKELLSLLGLIERFHWMEIFPSTKVRHFERLRKSCGFEYSEMLFFDDERRNIREVGDLGVETVHVTDGFDRSHFEEGVSRFGHSID